MSRDLALSAAEKGISYFLSGFVDLAFVGLERDRTLDV